MSIQRKEVMEIYSAKFKKATGLENSSLTYTQRKMNPWDYGKKKYRHEMCVELTLDSGVRWRNGVVYNSDSFDINKEGLDDLYNALVDWAEYREKEGWAS